MPHPSSVIVTGCMYDCMGQMWYCDAVVPPPQPLCMQHVPVICNPSSVSLLRHIIASSNFVNPSFSLSVTLAFHSAKYPRKSFCSHCKMCTCIKHESFFSFRYTCLYIIGIIGAVIPYSTYIELKVFTTEVGPAL